MCGAVGAAKRALVSDGTDPTRDGGIDLHKDVSLSGRISPSLIAADQNDDNPARLATVSTLRLSSDASRNIAGLQSGGHGRLLVLHNVGTNDLVLKDESASSLAANRFAPNADVTLGADQAVALQYDATSGRCG